MEQQILELIEEEVSRRVSLHMRDALQVVSTTYDIPLDRLMKDTASLEPKFCKGVLKSKQRCLKKPKCNGYCGFHQGQVPAPPPKPVERVPAPWEM
jgi:hypothetical protein